MDSLNLDSSNPLTVKMPPMLNDKNCEQLFDELFEKNNIDSLDDDLTELNVKRPIRTYQKFKGKLTTFKAVKLYKGEEYEEVHENNDEEEHDEQDTLLSNEHDPLFKPEDKNRKQHPRKKKLAYPNVSKDAVLEAFTKAIESQELPDFDEIEKFPLNIVTESERKERNKQTRKKQSAIHPISKKIKQSKANNKSRSKISSNIDQDQENIVVVGEQKVSRESRLRRSNRGKSVLSEKNSNQAQNPLNFQNDLIEKELFDLDESCIPKTSQVKKFLATKSNLEPQVDSVKNNRKNKNEKKIKSSTPFMSIKNRSTQSRLLRSTTRENLFLLADHSIIDLSD